MDHRLVTSDQALVAIAGGAASEKRQAVFFSRDEKGANDALWHAVLGYFASPRHPDEFGAFPFWFCATLTNPKRGEIALRTLFGSLSSCAQKEAYLSGLGEALREKRFDPVRRWLGLQGPLLTDIADGWKSQAPQTESYGCTHNQITTFAGLIFPLLREEFKADLAQACLEGLVSHQIPPSNGQLSCWPDALSESFTLRAVPNLIGLLNLGLQLSGAEDLRPYLRARKRISSGGHPGLALTINVFAALTAHPEWSLAPYRGQVPADALTRVLSLLSKVPSKRFERIDKESWPDYQERLKPLGDLLPTL